MTADEWEKSIDLKFGRYLIHCRKVVGLDMIEVVWKAKITLNRLMHLESGRAAKAITRAECERLALTLRLDVEDLMRKAQGDAE